MHYNTRVALPNVLEAIDWCNSNGSASYYNVKWGIVMSEETRDNIFADFAFTNKKDYMLFVLHWHSK